MWVMCVYRDEDCPLPKPRHGSKVPEAVAMLCMPCFCHLPQLLPYVRLSAEEHQQVGPYPCEAAVYTAAARCIDINGECTLITYCSVSTLSTCSAAPVGQPQLSSDLAVRCEQPGAWAVHTR